MLVNKPICRENLDLNPHRALSEGLPNTRGAGTAPPRPFLLSASPSQSSEDEMEVPICVTMQALVYRNVASPVDTQCWCVPYSPRAFPRAPQAHRCPQHPLCPPYSTEVGTRRAQEPNTAVRRGNGTVLNAGSSPNATSAGSALSLHSLSMSASFTNASPKKKTGRVTSRCQDTSMGRHERGGFMKASLNVGKCKPKG